MSGQSATTPPSRSLRLVMATTDIGFILYWAVSGVLALGWLSLPADWLYSDYSEPMMLTWNWSFAPLDLLASVTGLWALARARRGRPWASLGLISATLTFCAGFMAISFWAIGQDFDLTWWLPNLFLMVWPIAFVRELASPLNQTRAVGDL
jgi:hypothetical protein